MRILQSRGGRAAACALAAPCLAMAGAAVAATPSAPGPAAPAPGPAKPAATGAQAARPTAAQLSYMQLQAQYKGPLADTVIERWRDPIDGTICYIYLPIVVQHSPPAAGGFVQYGANHIGSISCLSAKF